MPGMKHGQLISYGYLNSIGCMHLRVLMWSLKTGMRAHEMVKTAVTRPGLLPSSIRTSIPLGQDDLRPWGSKNAHPPQGGGRPLGLAHQWFSRSLSN